MSKDACGCPTALASVGASDELRDRRAQEELATSNVRQRLRDELDAPPFASTQDGSFFEQHACQRAFAIHRGRDPATSFTSSKWDSKVR